MRERTLPRCVAGQLEAACRGGNCKTRNKRISISYPKQQQQQAAKGLPSSHTWRNQKRSQLDRATWGPPFPFFHHFGTLSHIDDNNHWINRRICRRCLFLPRVFLSIFLSLFGVVSTRKFPIARENSQVFYVCFLLCVGTQDSLLSTYNYVILELLRCEDKKGSVSLVVALKAFEMSKRMTEFSGFGKRKWKSMFPNWKQRMCDPLWQRNHWPS